MTAFRLNRSDMLGSSDIPKPSVRHVLQTAAGSIDFASAEFIGFAPRYQGAMIVGVQFSPNTMIFHGLFFHQNFREPIMVSGAGSSQNVNTRGPDCVRRRWAELRTSARVRPHAHRRVNGRRHSVVWRWPT
jgi:hypothetical protein